MTPEYEKTIGRFKSVSTKGRASKLLEDKILETSKYYTRLSVRQLYYILISKHRYRPSRKFYKVLNYHLTKMRRVNPKLHMKFVDPTRHFVRAPIPYQQVELWVEKDSIRNFLGDLATRYRLSVQVLRGFASLSMYRTALERAAKRGVKQILYLGDFDPSGLLIDRVAEREMVIEVTRVGLTKEQVKKYRPPSLSVNMKDSRAGEYVKNYGKKCWELEALRPRTFLRIVEEDLRKHVPSEYLAKAEAKQRAVNISKPLVRRLAREIHGETLRLLEAGLSPDEIMSRLTAEYNLQLGKPQNLEDEEHVQKQETPH